VYVNCKSPQLKEIYLKLVEARKRKVSREELKELISEAISAICNELKLYPVNISKLEEIIARGAVIIAAGEDEKYMAIRVKVINGERKVLEVKNDKVREVDSIFS